MKCCQKITTSPTYQTLLNKDNGIQITPEVGYVQAIIEDENGEKTNQNILAYTVDDRHIIVMSPIKKYDPSLVGKTAFDDSIEEYDEGQLVPITTGVVFDSTFSQLAFIQNKMLGILNFKLVTDDIEVPIEPPTRLELLASGCYQKLTSIDNRIATLIDDETTDAIDSFREMIDFLQGVTNDETFQNIINSISHEAESLDTATWPIEDDEEEEQP